MQKELQKYGKIAILGQEYTIYVNTAKNLDYYGLTLAKTKEIIIANDILDDIDRTIHVLKHEITHAMLYECGLEQYAEDELLVDWIARKTLQIMDYADSVYNTIKGGDKQ